MTTILLMMNNYFHDFATAVLMCNLALLYGYDRTLAGKLAMNAEQRLAVLRFANKITIGAIVWISVGGMIRSLNYRTFEWVEAAGKGQVVALGVKHAIMGGVVVAGLWMQYAMNKRMKSKRPADLPPAEIAQ